jgi:hypothetical protein
MLLQYFIRALIRVNFFTISQAACSSSTRDMQLVVAVTTLIRLKWPNHNRAWVTRRMPISFANWQRKYWSSPPPVETRPRQLKI